METKCEVIGWLHVAEKAEMLVREENGRISRRNAGADDTFGHCAIQTGSFRRLNPIFDPLTSELVGYEMERLSSPLAAIV